ncbi:MAG: response regulator transcription factor, partial [Phormidesmis sp.]
MSELQRDGSSEALPDRVIASPMENRPLQLMLVDEDPVFRLGLKVWLEQQGDFAVIAEAETAAVALTQVQTLMAPPPSTPTESTAELAATPASDPPLDLVILDLGLGARDLEATPGLQLCQQLKTNYPNLPVLVLSAQAEPVLQAAAEQMGANGYGTRSMPVRRLAQLIRQVASSSPSSTLTPSSPTPSIPPSPTPPL